MHSIYLAPAIGVRLLLAYLFFVVIVPCVVEASPLSVAVIYPEVAPPYNTVLAQIISGINKQAEIDVKEYPLSEGYDSTTLRKTLEEQKTEVIIALGRRGIEAVQALSWKKPFIVGAASLTPSLMNIYGKSMSAIRLTPDPDLMFAKLRELSPKSKRIIVVPSAPQGSGSVAEGTMPRATAPQGSGSVAEGTMPRATAPQGSESVAEGTAATTEEAWLLSAAREAAKKHDFELVIYPATDLRMAANLYRQIIGSMKSGSDALWLPPDNESIDIRSILPAILQGAWDRRVIVFGSNPAHVKRGALFALYPDNFKTGQHLAALAMDAVKNGHTRIVPTRDILTAVNIRTAEHLRLSEIEQKQKNFDAVYPAP